MFDRHRYSKGLIFVGAAAAVVVFAGAAAAIAAIGAGSGGAGNIAVSAMPGAAAGYRGMMSGAPVGGSGYGYGMMGGGYGGMMGGGYGSSATSGSGATTGHGPTQRVTLRIKSDTEHGKRGADGNWHDAFLPANFSVRAGDTVKVTVLNYDDMPHSFTSPMLGLDEGIPAGSARAPHKTTFTFTAPSTGGRYMWWCALPCDPYSMDHFGFMRGFVNVRT
jgi:plastocyanin